EALNPQNPPDISVEQREVTPLGQGVLVQIHATYHGDRAAATVVIEATLHAPDARRDDPPLEAGDVTFDFVPAGSSRDGGIVFTRGPAGYTLDFQVKRFVEPEPRYGSRPSSPPMRYGRIPGTPWRKPTKTSGSSCALTSWFSP